MVYSKCVRLSKYAMTYYLHNLIFPLLLSFLISSKVLAFYAKSSKLYNAHMLNELICHPNVAKDLLLYLNVFNKKLIFKYLSILSLHFHC